MKKYNAKLLFIDGLGTSKIVSVSFDEPKKYIGSYQEILENLSIFKGYDKLLDDKVPTIISDDEGYYYERLISIKESR